MSIKIFIDGAEIPADKVTITSSPLGMPGSFRLHDPVPYGATVTFVADDEWRFGDILAFRDPPNDGRFMFVCDTEDPSAVDPIWVMCLTDEGLSYGWRIGDMALKNRRIFQLIETTNA